MSERLAGLIEDYKARENYAERLVVKSARRLMSSSRWQQSTGSTPPATTSVSTRAASSTGSRDKISALESRLDPKRFLRIHRSTIVNTEAIREIRSLPHGEGLVKLADGQLLSMSRTYRERLDGLIA